MSERDGQPPGQDGQESDLVHECFRLREESEVLKERSHQLLQRLNEFLGKLKAVEIKG